jgi:hypothetical protein
MLDTCMDNVSPYEYIANGWIYHMFCRALLQIESTKESEETFFLLHLYSTKNEFSHL